MMIMPFVVMAIDSDEDRDYMEWLYKKYHRLMLATAWKYTSNRYEVEDIVSDSVVALIGKIDSLRTMQPAFLRAYVVSTVRNTSINHFRKKQGLDERFVSVNGEMVSQIADPDGVATRIILHDELIATLRVIHSLSPKEQSVLRLKCLDGMSNEDISLATGLASESIRKYLSRARKKVRDAIYEMEDPGQ